MGYWDTFQEFLEMETEKKDGNREETNVDNIFDMLNRATQLFIVFKEHEAAWQVCRTMVLFSKAMDKHTAGEMEAAIEDALVCTGIELFQCQEDHEREAHFNPTRNAAVAAAALGLIQQQYSGAKDGFDDSRTKQFFHDTIQTLTNAEGIDTSVEHEKRFTESVVALVKKGCEEALEERVARQVVSEVEDIHKARRAVQIAVSALDNMDNKNLFKFLLIYQEWVYFDPVQATFWKYMYRKTTRQFQEETPGTNFIDYKLMKQRVMQVWMQIQTLLKVSWPHFKLSTANMIKVIDLARSHHAISKTQRDRLIETLDDLSRLVMQSNEPREAARLDPRQLSYPRHEQARKKERNSRESHSPDLIHSIAFPSRVPFLQSPSLVAV
jgi:hypothetical protein